MQKSQGDREEKASRLQSENSVLKQELQNKLKDLDMMGQMIEEHTEQI